MKAVWKKALADLVGRPWQSLLIVSTVGAAAAMLYLGIVTLAAAASPYDKQMERTNGAHAFLFIRGPERELLAGQVTALPDVVQSTVRPAMFSELLIKGADRNPSVIVTGVAPGQPAMMGYIIIEGRELKAEDRNGAVVDISVANYHHLSVGDQIALSTPQGPRSLTLVGLHAEPLWCQYPFCGNHSLYVLPETVAELKPTEEERILLVGLRLESPATSERFVNQMPKTLGEKTSISSAHSYLEIRSATQQMQGFSVIFVLVFGVMAVLAAAMIMANIISGAVLGQFREIGVLKAIGYTRGQVLLLFVGQNLALSIVGSTGGLLAGHLLAYRTLGPVAQNMGTPEVVTFQPMLALIVAAAALTITVIVAVISAWRAVTVRPADVLRDGFSTPSAKTPWVVRLLIAVGSPTVMTIGVKDAVARRGRVVMTVISVGLCLATIAMSVTFTDLINRFMQDPAMKGINFDLSIDRNHLTQAEAEQFVANDPNISSYYTVDNRRMSVDGTDTFFYVWGLGGAWRSFDFPIVRGRLPQADDEIVLAVGAAESTGAQVGERVPIKFRDRVVSMAVVGHYRTVMEMGKMGMMTQEALRQFVPEVKPTMMLARVKPGISRPSARQALLERTGYRLSVTAEDNGLPSFVRDLLNVMKLLSALMVGIAAFSVLGTCLLSAREQMKEVGIRKAIGMTPRQILLATGCGGAWLGMIGSVVGIPTGILLNQALIGQLSRNWGLGEIQVPASAALVTALVICGVLLAAVATFPAAIWANRLTTAQVLHSE